jgi:parvulin-like peptidyl-prolyl isomerase
MKDEKELEEISLEKTKFKKYFAMVIAIVITFAMVGFGLIDFARYTSDYVIKVEDKKVTPERFARYLEAQKRQYIMRFGSGIIESFLNTKQFSSIIAKQMADQLLISQMLEDNGILIDKNTVNKYILNHPQFQDINGKFDLEFYQNYIRQSGFTEETYILDQISILQNKFFIQMFALNDFISFEKIAKKTIENERKTREINIFKVKLEDPKTFNPTEKEIQDFYEKNKQNYKIKEEKVVIIAKIDEKTIPNNIKQEEILKEYNKEYLYKNQTINFEKLSFTSMQEAQRIEGVIKNEGLDLKVVASNILGLNLSEIEFKNINFNDLDIELQNQIAKLQKKQISEVFYLAGSYHILKLNDFSTAKIPTFESVKSAITTKLKGKNSCQSVEKIASQINNEVESGESLENAIKEIATARKIVISEGEKIDLPENIAELILKDTDTYYAKIIKSKACEFYAYKVQEVRAESIKNLESIKNEILLALKDIAMKNEALVKASNLKQKISSNPDFKGTSLTINSKSTIFPAEEMEKILALKEGEVSMPFFFQNEFFIVRLQKINENAGEISKKDIDAKVKALKDEEKSTLIRGLIEELEKKYKVQINSAYL